MKKIFLFTILIMSVSGFAAKTPPKTPPQAVSAEPQLGNERVLFHLNVGDIAIGFFDQLAPKHTEQILKLARLGAFNGTRIFRIEPGFVAQLENYANRETPLPEDVLSQVVKIPAEFSDVHHVRGLLSMARFEDDVNSAETSFSFMLGEATHLDKEYTIFGKVVGGDSVLHQIEMSPRDKENVPEIPIVIQSTEILTRDELARKQLVIGHPAESEENKLRVLIISFAITAFSATVLTALVKTIFDKPPGAKANA